MIKTIRETYYILTNANLNTKKTKLTLIKELWENDKTGVVIIFSIVFSSIFLIPGLAIYFSSQSEFSEKLIIERKSFTNTITIPLDTLPQKSKFNLWQSIEKKDTTFHLGQMGIGGQALEVFFRNDSKKSLLISDVTVKTIKRWRFEVSDMWGAMSGPMKISSIIDLNVPKKEGEEITHQINHVFESGELSRVFFLIHPPQSSFGGPIEIAKINVKLITSSKGNYDLGDFIVAECFNCGIVSSLTEYLYSKDKNRRMPVSDSLKVYRERLKEIKNSDGMRSFDETRLVGN